MKSNITQKPFTGIKTVKATIIGLLLFILTSFQLVKAEVAYAISGTNLITFNTATPGTISSTVALTGIGAGQTVEGLDFRPANGQLYALGYVSASGLAQLYIINTKTGIASAVGSSTTLATGQTRLGFDFNPTVDRIRVTTFQKKNYRLNPNTGAIAATDTDFAYATGDPNVASAPGIMTCAYTNSFAGSTTTNIYYYDYTLDAISATLAPTSPNTGLITTVGNSGIVTNTGAGLDMDIVTNASGVNTAFLSANSATTINDLYTVNLTTGATTLIGAIGVASISEMAIYSEPVVSKLIYALSAGNLISFNSRNPSTILSSVAITGVQAGQTLEGLDFRPANGMLYSLGYISASGAAQVYTINTATAVATAIGSNQTLATGILDIGFDFNPVADRIRITSSNGNNYRLNPNDGAIAATDGMLAYAVGDPNAAATPALTTAGYSNSFAGTASTTFYSYDFNLNILTIVNPPNSGTINTVGASGIVPGNKTGLDLDITYNAATTSNTAFLSANVGSVNNLYNVNLTTGAASLIGSIGSGITITEMAVYIPSVAAPSNLVYGLSGSNLVSFKANVPGSILSTVAITGITAGQVIEGLDFRPATGQLFALGYVAASGQTQLYTVNITTGVATSVGAAVTLATGMSNLSVDFNPAVDRVRVLSSNGNSYRLNPNDGTISGTDTQLAYLSTDVNAGLTPAVTAAAYNNNVAGTTTTSLFYYDVAIDNLAVTLAPASPNTGQITTVGTTGLSVAAANTIDMDITTSNGANVALLTASNNLYTIIAGTGETKLLGTIGAANITEMAISTPTVINKLIYAVSANNLISFKSNAPGTILSSVAITGITAGQTIVGIDFRPANGLLYALGYVPASGLSQLYTINLSSAVAKKVGATSTLAINMAAVSINFNPVADRLRVVGSGGENYRINPADGVVTIDGSLTYAGGDAYSGALVAGAVSYTNSFAGSASTTIYYFDYTNARNSLATSAVPNSGPVNTIGSTGIVTITPNGLSLDISTDKNSGSNVNTAFLSANTTAGVENLYNVDLVTGAASLIGQIGSGIAISDMSVYIAPPATAKLVYAISGNNLVSFNANAPATILNTVALSGITAGQVIEGLDFRPANGLLYALGYVSATGETQLYTVNLTTGLATKVGTTLTLATGMTNIGVDFNPNVDRLRITSSGGNNYRVNPNDGTLTATDTNLTYVAGDAHAGVTPNVAAVAYSNNYAGTLATTIYAYEYAFNSLASAASPNTGVLNTIGNSNVAAATKIGLDMDITTDSALNNTAYLSASINGSSANFYTVDLSSGEASIIGTIGAPNITEMAIYIAPLPNKLIYAVTTASNLISFKSNTPGTIISTTAITGITAGQIIAGIDFRPATGQLYGLGYASGSGQAQVYTINLTTAAATTVGGAITLDAALTDISVDFNPVADRIRVTAGNGRNYRLNPLDGSLAATDGNITYAAGDPNSAIVPQVATVAYTNSYAGSTSTTIYYYDYTINNLAISSTPNTGQLTTVNPSTLAPANTTGLDMDIYSNKFEGTNGAFISVSNGAVNALYTFNLATGAAGLIGNIAASTNITDMSVYIAPVPANKLMYAVSGTNLVSFNSNTPGTIINTVALTGVAGGQVIEGLDFRPVTGQLYLLGYVAGTGFAQTYTVNTSTGIATSVGSTTLATNMLNIGFDFNPSVDRIRVTSNSGNNYRLNPVDGTIAGTDTQLSYPVSDAHSGTLPTVSGVAYINNVAAAPATTLYYYDFNYNSLASSGVASPNLGLLNTVGNSGLTTLSQNGLDMDIVTDVSGINTAFLSANVSGVANNLYTIELQTGEASLLGTIGAPNILEIAVSNTDALLPVTLLEFYGKKAGNIGELTWKTKSEVNNSYFVLERSADGNNFSSLSGRINSKAVNGNSATPLSYAYNDATPVKGINYYRLLQVDKDGRNTYTKTVQLTFNGNYEITMYPNPVSNFININGHLDAKADIEIVLTDMAGRIIQTTVLKGLQGNWNTQLKAAGLTTGMYNVIILKDKKQIHSSTVLKINERF